ncbi:MAG: hypothetical protein GY810_14775 [Aureispira sp.]|nr:hypothetical protein [Aureispira sp.]
MRKLSFLLVFLLSCTLINAQEADKTLVKTLDPEGASTVALDFKNKGVYPEIWDEGTLRIELEIHANMPEQILAQLVKAGRYTMKASLEGDVFHIDAPHLGKTVTIGGKDLEDEIVVYAKTPGYFIYRDGKLEKNIPDNTIVKVLARSETTADATAQLKKMRRIKEKINVTYRFVYKDPKAPKKATLKPNTNGETMDSAAPPGTLGKAPNSAKKDPNKELQQVQSKYGDILIDGVPLEFD